MAGASHSESQQVIFGGWRDTRGPSRPQQQLGWEEHRGPAPAGHTGRGSHGCGSVPGRAGIADMDLGGHSRAGRAGRAPRRSSTRPLALGSPVRIWLRGHSGRRAAATDARLSDLGSHCCDLRSSQGHWDDATDPSRTRDTAATRPEKPSWDRALSAPRSRPSLGNQPHLRGPAATGCSPAREFSRHNSKPFFPLNNNCSHPSFLVVTHTDTHYMYTIWARGPTARQGSQHRSGWCTHSAAVKGEVVLLSFKLAMFVFIL